jgi:MYXO-CTERM domain-containing protein
MYDGVMRPLRLPALATLLVGAALSASVRADLPPPGGEKFVDYSFVVTGLAVSPDRVFFAFPCGTSNGTPYKEHVKLEEGVPVRVGRRGGDCTIYSMAKGEYEAWAKDYKPTQSVQDPALDALAAKALKCTGAPALVFTLPTSDPRNAVQETLELKTSTATSCVLVSKGIPGENGGGATSGGNGGGATSGGNGGGSSPAGPAPKESGCTVTPGAAGSGELAFVAAAVAALLGRRRRR